MAHQTLRGSYARLIERINRFPQGAPPSELLHRILGHARREGIPNPLVYSHSCGLLLHEPGPMIGFPWNQKSTAGRGAVKLDYSYAFSMELSTKGPIPEWGGQEIHFPLEEHMVFTQDGCRLLDGRQTQFHLI